MLTIFKACVISNNCCNIGAPKVEILFFFRLNALLIIHPCIGA